MCINERKQLIESLLYLALNKSRFFYATLFFSTKLSFVYWLNIFPMPTLDVYTSMSVWILLRAHYTGFNSENENKQWLVSLTKIKTMSWCQLFQCHSGTPAIDTCLGGWMPVNEWMPVYGNANEWNLLLLWMLSYQ